MTEPSSTGIGGDMFCLYFDAKTRKVHSLNGSGRSPKNSSLEDLRKELGIAAGTNGKIPTKSVHSVTVPGAAAGWVDTIEKFGSGKLTMEQILTPAIELGEDGFPVSEISAHYVSHVCHYILYWILIVTFSGQMANKQSVMHHPTFAKCSNQIKTLRISFVLQEVAR